MPIRKLTMGPRTSGTSRRSGKPVNKADENNTNNNNSISTGDTGTPDTAAKLRNRVLDMAKKVMRGEERNVFFCELLKMGMGTKELENFVSGQAGLRMSRDECENDASVFKNEREFVNNAMENKLTDNIANLGKKKLELDKFKKRFAWVVKEAEVRKLKNRLREEVGREREMVKLDHNKQLREIRMSRKTIKKDKFKLPPELKRYRQAAVFGKEAEDIFKPGEVLGPVVVGKETRVFLSGGGWGGTQYLRGQSPPFESQSPPYESPPFLEPVPPLLENFPLREHFILLRFVLVYSILLDSSLKFLMT